MPVVLAELASLLHSIVHNLGPQADHEGLHQQIDIVINPASPSTGPGEGGPVQTDAGDVAPPAGEPAPAPTGPAPEPEQPFGTEANPYAAQ
jgi:hypothetical protein